MSTITLTMTHIISHQFGLYQYYCGKNKKKYDLVW
jgi:hypothetical protein